VRNDTGETSGKPIIPGEKREHKTIWARYRAGGVPPDCRNSTWTRDATAIPVDPEYSRHLRKIVMIDTVDGRDLENVARFG
jgi:hypothetical protein